MRANDRRILHERTEETQQLNEKTTQLNVRADIAVASYNALDPSSPTPDSLVLHRFPTKDSWIRIQPWSTDQRICGHRGRRMRNEVPLTR